MAEGWKRRWKPSGKKSKMSLIPVLEVQPFRPSSQMKWELPISKSHAIRFLIMASQSNDIVSFSNMKNAGEDIIAVKDCLSQLGVEIEETDDRWIVHGVGPQGFQPSKTVLNARNSGVTFRCMVALSSRIDGISMVDGDASLRKRPHGELIDSLSQLNIDVSFGTMDESLPLLFHGKPHTTSILQVDGSRSSQPITAWICASPGFTNGLTIHTQGDLVSTRHSDLSIELARMLGACVEQKDNQIIIHPWTPSFKGDLSSIKVPSDASMMSFAMLTAKALNASIEIANLPTKDQSIGHEILTEFAQQFGLTFSAGQIKNSDSGGFAQIDLRNANDLITPISAILALSSGGKISSISHAAYKESNRIVSTMHLLEQFGLKSTFTNDVLEVKGQQQLTSPNDIVKTFGDHRIQMTAMILALACDAKVQVEGTALHRVADADAVDRFIRAGAQISMELYDPN